MKKVLTYTEDHVLSETWYEKPEIDYFITLSAKRLGTYVFDVESEMKQQIYRLLNKKLNGELDG